MTRGGWNIIARKLKFFLVNADTQCNGKKQSASSKSNILDSWTPLFHISLFLYFYIFIFPYIHKSIFPYFHIFIFALFYILQNSYFCFFRPTLLRILAANHSGIARSWRWRSHHLCHITEPRDGWFTIRKYNNVAKYLPMIGIHYSVYILILQLNPMGSHGIFSFHN